MAFCCCVFTSSLKSAASYVIFFGVLVSLIELIFCSLALKHHLWEISDMFQELPKGLLSRIVYAYVVVTFMTLCSGVAISFGLRLSIWYLWLPWLCFHLLTIVVNIIFCGLGIWAVSGDGGGKSDLVVHGMWIFTTIEMSLIVFRIHWLTVMITIYGKLYPEEDKKRLLESSRDES